MLVDGFGTAREALQSTIGNRGEGESPERDVAGTVGDVGGAGCDDLILCHGVHGAGPKFVGEKKNAGVEE